MSQLSKASFETTYQNSSGTFADNTTRQITEADMRQFADDIADSALFLDDAYDSLQFIIDGGGSAITTGIKGDLVVPYNCTILGWDLLADTAGLIKIDVWKNTYANFPPVDGNSITSTDEPEIGTTGIKAQNIPVTVWTTTLTRNDILRFNVDSCTSITRATLNIRVKRTAA